MLEPLYGKGFDERILKMVSISFFLWMKKQKKGLLGMWQLMGYQMGNSER